MYFLKGSTIVSGVTSGEVDSNTIRLLEYAIENTLFESHKYSKFEVCKPCRVKFGTIVHHTKGMLDYVHSDV